MTNNVIILFGASGDLAKRKTLPALYSLFLHSNQHSEIPTYRIIGYARSHLTPDDIKQKSKPFLSKVTDSSEESINSFFEGFQYISGQYDTDEGYQEIKKNIESTENMVFYLALPPSQFVTVATKVKQVLYNPRVENRLVVEKPFGKDTQSSKEMLEALSKLFKESEMFRIDHYLGKEMVKNLLTLRFANLFFNSLWHRQYIDNVQIVFKETLGVEGRGGYFDEYGIIRDVLQNHMLQMLSMVAMERPSSLDPEYIRDEKVKVLRCIDSIKNDENVVIGQYGPGKEHTGYVQEETVPSSSLAATYAAMILRIKNERWDGVPFILKCGKGLSESKSEIRVQFRDVPGNLFTTPNTCSSLPRNELVLRVSPSESIYLKLLTKKPGLGMEPLLSDLDLSYYQRYEHIRIPDAYESLLLDVMKGDLQNFVRSDELQEAWRIVTPLLHEIEEKRIVPIEYPFGSRGPKEGDDLSERSGYKRNSSIVSSHYAWPKMSLSPKTSQDDLKTH